MDHTIGNIIIYIFGISLGVSLSRYLYIWAGKNLIDNINNKVVAVILNTIVIIVGFVMGFIVVIILWTILRLIVIGHE